MTTPRRNTKYARELAAASRPAGGKASVAIERIHVKEADEVRIRFSAWQGTRLRPKALDLTEDELLPLLRAALEAGVFSGEFAQGLSELVQRFGRPPVSEPLELTELDHLQARFHALIRARAGRSLSPDADLPVLALDAGREDAPAWYPVEGMKGGFKYWWDPAASGLRLISESWSETVEGSGQLHEITPDGARLLGEGFV